MFFFGNKNKKAKARIVADVPASAPETTQTLNQLHQTRKMLNNIYNSMCDIDFATIERKEALQNASITLFVKRPNDETGETSFVEVERSGVEVLNDISSTVSRLKKKLEAEDAASLLEQETAVIDAKLWKFAQTLHTSLDNSHVDLDTARACVTGLLYGIMEGHRGIPESFDADEREKELRVRERKIDDFEKIIDISKDINDLRTTRNKLREQNNSSVVPKYKDARKLYEEDRNAHRSIYDDINGLNGYQAREISAAHETAWRNTAHLNNLESTHKRLEVQIVIINDAIKRFEDNIESIKNATALESIFSNEKLLRKIAETVNIIPNKINEINHDVLELQRILDELDNNVIAAINSHDIEIAKNQVMNKRAELDRQNERERECKKEDEATRQAELMVEAEREQLEADIEKQRLAEKYETEKAKVEEEIKTKMAEKSVEDKPPVMKTQHKLKKTK